MKVKYIGNSPCIITAKEGKKTLSYGDEVEVNEADVAGNNKFIEVSASSKKSKKEKDTIREDKE